LNDLTAFVYLPAWMVAIVAALGRRPVLGAAALLVVVAQVVFMLPELTAAEPVPTWAAGAQTVQLLDANVYSGNPSMVGYAAQIQQFRPDLVTMQEASPTDVLQLQAANALVNLPYQFEVKRWDPTAFFIASHYLIRGVHVVYLYGRPLIVQLTVELPSGPLPLWVVHTVAPLPSSYRQWKGQMTVIDQLLRTRGPADLLLVGDFNATWGSNGFRRILNAGMSDGAATRGEPFAMTWSQTMPVVPPLVRIDHVLTGPGVAVTKIANGAGEGSDHRDLIATVAVDHRPPA
jgi:endonuclease/exonuclease/phosphatase (EEP) superfamily protein YafD